MVLEVLVSTAILIIMMVVLEFITGPLNTEIAGSGLYLVYYSEGHKPKHLSTSIMNIIWEEQR